MKRLLLLAIAVLTLAGTARANSWWDNYRPDNRNVRLTSTNLPIVWIDVNGNYIDRDERITARMKIIYNGAGSLNYADTVAHPGQTIDYEGYVALRYRGSSSFSMSDKKPYSFRPLDKPLEEGGEKKKVKILGMGKDNNWALLAPYADKSMLRDLLAFEVSRPWMEYTPQGRFCEMYLDGIYYGVYILTEVVSKGKHRVNLPDPGESGDPSESGDPAVDEITITTQPQDVSVRDGEEASFTVEAEGNGIGYQWQWSSDGSTWKNCTSTGYNEAAFSFTMKAKYAGRRYRCEVTADGETLISDAALLILKEEDEIDDNIMA